MCELPFRNSSGFAALFAEKLCFSVAALLDRGSAAAAKPLSLPEGGGFSIEERANLEPTCFRIRKN